MEAIAIQQERAYSVQAKSQRDVSIDYLRTTITVLVVLAHSSAAYTRTSHILYPAHIYNMLVPIIDDERHSSIICDIVLGVADLFFMALMFFISALFAYPSLRRHGVKKFLRDRLLRIGLPFAVSVVFLLPVGLFASYQLFYPQTSYFSFWRQLAREHFFSGPPWFLWVLLVFDFALAMLFVLCKPAMQQLEPWLRGLKNRPASGAVLLTVLSALSYAALRHRYGSSYDVWRSFITAPFTMQPARMGIYICWCTAGFLVGSLGLEEGLLSRSGTLVKHWKLYMVTGLLGFGMLMLRYLHPSLQTILPSAQPLFYAFAWSLSVSALCFACLSVFRTKFYIHRTWMDSLTRCAYVIYLVHFVFVIWAQRLMLPMQVSAMGKFLIVFVVTLSLSWITAIVLIRIPGVRRVV